MSFVVIIIYCGDPYMEACNVIFKYHIQYSVEKVQK